MSDFLDKAGQTAKNFIRNEFSTTPYSLAKDNISKKPLASAIGSAVAEFGKSLIEPK